MTSSGGETIEEVEVTIITMTVEAMVVTEMEVADLTTTTGTEMAAADTTTTTGTETADVDLITTTGTDVTDTVIETDTTTVGAMAEGIEEGMTEIAEVTTETGAMTEIGVTTETEGMVVIEIGGTEVLTIGVSGNYMSVRR